MSTLLRDPAFGDEVTLRSRSREAMLVRETLGRVTLHATKGPTSSKLENVAKRIARGTIQTPEHIVGRLYDAFLRGAPKADVQAVAHAILAITDEWYEGAQPSDDLVKLIAAETHIEGRANDAEIALMDGATYQEVCECEQWVSRHIEQLERLATALRARKYAVR